MGNRDNKISINNILYAFLFLVVGMMLINRDETIVTLISKVIGCVFITIGGIKTIVYIYMKGKLGNYKLNSLLIGLIFIAIGISFIVLSGVLDWTIRVIVGLWCIFSGINQMIFAFTYKKYYKEGFAVYLLTSVAMLLVGVLILSVSLSWLIGVLIVAYAVFEIFNYIYYKTKGKDIPSNEKVESKLPALKNDKVVEAVIEEDNTK